ncbi:UNVERIFIED_CONTAM: hypothetical protein K2H54_054719 [Gekko kuhli]
MLSTPTMRHGIGPVSPPAFMAFNLWPQERRRWNPTPPLIQGTRRSHKRLRLLRADTWKKVTTVKRGTAHTTQDGSTYHPGHQDKTWETETTVTSHVGDCDHCQQTHRPHYRRRLGSGESRCPPPSPPYGRQADSRNGPECPSRLAA